MLITACQKPVSEPVIEKELTLPAFVHVKATGIERVEVVKGGVQKVVARMREDAHLRLRSRVTDDTLMLEVQGPAGEILQGSMTISLPDVLSVTLSGRGAGLIHGFSGTERIIIAAKEQRIVTARVSATELRTEATNGSNILLEGQGRSLIMSATNKALITAVDYPVQFSSALAQDNASIYTTVTNTLNASAIKSSRIYYKGNPLTLLTSELELGKVISMD
jgi:hypothetical protein